MTSKKDYYEILGVPRDADEKAIKAAYRKLARRHHPDVNQGDKAAEEKFKEISAAFAVLSDPDKRARYDRGGHAAFGPDFDPFADTGFDFRTTGFGFPDLSEIFEMFGLGGVRGGRSRRPRRGQDLQLELRIPFSDAVRGATVEVAIPRHAACGTCGGRGLGPVGDRCRSCGGGGLQRVEERLKVRIPAGIDDGGRVRLAGKGDAGPSGGPPGNAYLVVRVTPDPTFRREGRNLVCEVPVGLATAALGGSVTVPTLDGTATITLPAGTKSGQKFRLKGRGVPGQNSKPDGDLLAVIQIHPPRRLDARSRELLEEFAKLNPNP